MPVVRSLRTVVRPANLDDALPVGRLWALAFADKFGPAFGDVPEHNAALLADLHRLGEGRMLRATLVAEAEGEVIGFLLAHPGHEGFADFPLMEGVRTMVRHLGLLGFLRAVLVLGSMGGGDRHARDEIVVEMVGVDPRYQGCGVGQALMRAAIDRARQVGARLVTLGVVWGNERARRLYERLGFTAVRDFHTPLARWAVGYRGWTLMALPLDLRE